MFFEYLRRLGASPLGGIVQGTDVGLCFSLYQKYYHVMSSFLVNPLAFNPASRHLFNPAGSAHTCIQIPRTYDSCR
jgi:hypothetical protein